MEPTPSTLEEAQQLTALSLAKALQTTEEFTYLKLDEVTELSNEVARLLPAGNILTMVLSQLGSIKGRQLSENDTRRILNLLNRGISTFLDRAAYMTFYTGPALLIGGYQLLLRATGHDLQAAFPNGVWQFYLEFGLRDDSARHACETIGFQERVAHEHLPLSGGDELAAWLLAVMGLLEKYDALVAQEWNELTLLRELTHELDDKRVTSQWLAQRPYHVPSGDNSDYVSYRRTAFQQFIRESLARKLRQSQVERTLRSWDFSTTETLEYNPRAAYQRQMSILATLTPGEYCDTRTPLALTDSQVVVYFRGRYYKVPVVHNNIPLSVEATRLLAHAIIGTQTYAGAATGNFDELLIPIPRQQQATRRAQLAPDDRRRLEDLRRCPVILNWETVSGARPLGDIRQGRRGIGDHALTLFKTDRSMVFDLSHIFFDAIWGMAVAEIVTGEAIRHARHLATLKPIQRTSMQVSIIDVSVSDPRTVSSPKRMSARISECSAETIVRVVPEINALRTLLTKRNEALQLSVNDFLVLYRALYNQHYKASHALASALHTLTQSNMRQKQAAYTVWDMLQAIPNTLPAFLIPMDATKNNPRERIFPVTFRPGPPWTDLAVEHDKTYGLLQSSQADPGNKTVMKAFNDSRTDYLEMLRMFGVLMARYKEIALAGQSFSTFTLKILASVPRRLQPLFRNIPDRIDILNDMLKGTEVFSNVGHVADSSSLTRFMTAKDDNEKKELCWGVMTRADDLTMISLRDFRGPVLALAAAGAEQEAQMVTQDFLDGYARGLQIFIHQLTEIIRFRRK